MLTPAEEVGLAGLRLASRVSKALDRIPAGEVKALIESIHQLAARRHLAYQRDGVTETIRLLPCPITLRQDQVAYVHYVSQIVHNCVKKLPDLYFSSPAVHGILRLTAEEERWLAECWTACHREANPIFGRLDAMVDFTSPMWKDSLKFVEPNLTGIGGVHLGPTSDRVLAEVLIPAIVERDPKIRLALGADVRELLLQDLSEHLDAIGRPGGRIAFVDPKYETEGPDEPESLVQYYRDRHGIEVLHADPSELTREGDEVYYRGHRIDVAYRDYTVLELRDLVAEGVDVEPMKTLFATNRMVSSIAADLDQKSCWEVFTDPALVAQFFSPEERQVLRRHVLWTRVIADRRTTDPGGASIELLSFARHERESLVLKPNRSYGGDGVLIGPAVGQGEWESALDSAAADPDERWVVQQVTPIPVKEFHVIGDDGAVHLEPFYVVMGFAPSRYGVGLIARASQKQVVNVAQRGGECAVMVSSSVVG